MQKFKIGDTVHFQLFGTYHVGTVIGTTRTECGFAYAIGTALRLVVVNEDVMFASKEALLENMGF